jgi:hypothetical protein
MTIDERLEALTARHEALTQSLELLTYDVREMRASMDHRFAKTAEIFETALDSIKRLETIATAHEHRISRLEDEAS